MGINKITNPKFLFCEIPIKTGNEDDDHRVFIYCVEYLSLIEVFLMSNKHTYAFSREQYQKTFFHNNEEFLLVFTQNNIELLNSANELDHITNGTEPVTSSNLINEAWAFFDNYLDWEDERALNEF